ncbi:MAG: hypothetical protein WAV41_02480 [Microgenomates group bacterium]
MPENSTFYLLLLSTSLSYLISISSYSHYIPQLIALCLILFYVFYRLQLNSTPLISTVVNLIVFSTGGLSSPFYFLIYFLLFATAFVIKPVYSLLFSLITILLLGQSLVNPASLLSLISLLFIAPLVWLVSRQKSAVEKSTQTISNDETNFLLWLNLKFKTGITTIIDLNSQLLSTPQLSPTQKEIIKKIRQSSHSLLNSSAKLTQQINDEDDI